MKFGVCFVAILFIFCAVRGETLPACELTSYAESNASERDFFLRSLKYKLIQDSQKSMQSIASAKNMLVQCQAGSCPELYESFMAVLNEQMHLAKMVKAIVKKGGLQRVNARQVFTVSGVLRKIKSGSLQPTEIGSYSIDGFEYSKEDQEKTLQLWQHIYVKTVAHLPQQSHYQASIDATNLFFRQLSHDLIALNPLLAFLNENDLSEPQKIFAVFDKLVQFNQDFLVSVEDMKTRHSTTFWSTLNLTSPDHEMGLVNFSNYANGVVEQYSRTETDQKILCSAWVDLKSQQRRRIISSIGVGTAAAVVCGVGIWSGVGTIPAAAICSFTVADGLWGARRGYMDSEIAYISRFAGVQALSDGTFSQGMLSLSESKKQELQGDVVFLINIIGIVPVARALKMAQPGVRGKIFDLVKIPGSDVVVSTIESQSANIGYGLLILQKSDMLNRQMDRELNELMATYR